MSCSALSVRYLRLLSDSPGYSIAPIWAPSVAGRLVLDVASVSSA